MLSRKCKYALQALLFLARQPPEEMILVSDIAEKEKLPRKFLETILLELNRKGLVQSRRGRGGGYALAKPADLISFGTIVRTIDGPLAPVACVSIKHYQKCADCKDEQTCEIRGVMWRVRNSMTKELDGTSLADAVGADAAAPGKVDAGAYRRGETNASISLPIKLTKATAGS